MRTTLNIKHSNPADLAKHLRSLAAKIDADTIVPGADLQVGTARVQVAQVQESDIRAFARANGLPVGSRGRISQEVQDAFKAHQRAERKAKREERAARKAEREAAAQETVNA